MQGFAWKSGTYTSTGMQSFAWKSGNFAFIKTQDFAWSTVPLSGALSCFRGCCVFLLSLT